MNELGTIKAKLAMALGGLTNLRDRAREHDGVNEEALEEIERARTSVRRAFDIIRDDQGTRSRRGMNPKCR